MKQKRALFITPRPIFPIVGGDQIRWSQSLYLLSHHFLVDVFFLDEFGVKNEVKKHANYVQNVFHHRIPQWKCYLNSLKFLFNGKPIQVNYYLFKDVKSKIRQILNDYDAVYCNLIRTTEYVANTTNIIKYVDFVDSISKNYDVARKKAKGLKKVIYTIDYYLCRRYEKNILEKFNACSIISHVDRDFISTKNRMYVINNMANIILNRPKKNNQMDKQKNMIVFLGKMSYEPNIVAVTHFVKTIYPFIQQYNKNITFYIVGINPTEAVLKLQTHTGVVVTGYVEDPIEFLLKAKVVIAPMITGAGIQNKIIQAMAVGCSVVTTPIGSEGLCIEHNEISIVEANHEFAEEIIRLLNDNDSREEMGKRAKEYVKNNLSINCVMKKFDEFIQAGNTDFVGKL